MPPKISLEDFKSLCKEKYRYTGYVEGLGQVYWVPRHVWLPMSDMPSQTPYNTPHGSRFTTTIYEMKVVKEEKNESTGIKALESIANIGGNILSIYGVATSVESMSKKKVLVGRKYNRINWQGTVVHNPNRGYVFRREIAQKVGNKILIAGIIVDWSLVAMGKRNWWEALINTAVNVGIWAIGIKCAPAAVALGIVWYIMSNSSDTPYVRNGTNEEIHGMMPVDNLRIVPRIPDLFIKHIEPVYEQKQYYFRQGR